MDNVDDMNTDDIVDDVANVKDVVALTPFMIAFYCVFRLYFFKGFKTDKILLFKKINHKELA